MTEISESHLADATVQLYEDDKDPGVCAKKEDGNASSVQRPLDPEAVPSSSTLKAQEPETFEEGPSESDPDTLSRPPVLTTQEPSTLDAVLLYIGNRLTIQLFAQNVALYDSEGSLT